MSEGQFEADINRAANLCEKLGILQFQRRFPRYDDSDVARLRKLSYADQWIWYTEKGQYQLMLNDLAIVQFTRAASRSETTALCYHYLECPFDAITYPKFLLDYGASYETVRDEFWGDYTDHVTTTDLKKHVTPIRYDFSPTQYTEGLHPAAHLHVGLNNEMRVATERLWRPLSFMLFLIRQRYCSHWQMFHGLDNENKLVGMVREQLDPISKEHWSGKDLWEAFLS